MKHPLHPRPRRWPLRRKPQGAPPVAAAPAPPPPPKVADDRIILDLPVEPAPAPKPPSEVAELGPIRVDALSKPAPGSEPDAQATAAVAPAEAAPPPTINLDDLIFGDTFSASPAHKPAEEQASTIAQSPEPSTQTPDENWVEMTFGASAETMHSQDTIQLPPKERPAPELPEGGHPDDGLDVTRALTRSESPQVDIPEDFAETLAAGSQPGGQAFPPQETVASAAPVEQNYYVLPSAVGDSQLDERSEMIFREQYNKGIKAVNEKNWKQAVHYLAIAAAIHPNNEQLRGASARCAR